MASLIPLCSGEISVLKIVVKNFWSYSLKENARTLHINNKMNHNSNKIIKMIITSTQAIFGRYCLHCLDEELCG